jgi:hypothetical protein
MIAQFPAPYRDELWYSVGARFSDRMQFGTETGTMQALYGSRHAVATVDLPHRLGALVSQLPPGHVCTVETIIDQHTFLPYYSPFLTTCTYAKVRGWMEDSTKSSVRVKCGACTNRVRPPKFFRSCPLCDRENRDRDGETYWRRLFQLPGVEVCPIHEVFLEPSDIRLDPLANRHRYNSAERAHLGTMVHLTNTQDPAHRILLDLAERIDWLLDQERLNPGLEFMHQQYGAVLASKGFATRAGSVRMDDLRRTVLAFYGSKLLDLLQCGLPPEKGDGWLGYLLRKPNTAVAPLRHLLLLLALEVDLERFFYPDGFEQAVQPCPAAAGPWPCLSRVCQNHGKTSIGHADVQPPDTNGVRHLVIRCTQCGFTYQLRDGAEIPTRANHVIDYGPTWKNLLRQQWADYSISLRLMANNLGVDPKTVKRRAVELGLAFPREGKRPVTKRGLYVAKQRDKTKRLESHRRAWTELRRGRPAAGTKELRSHAPALYAWLYRNDRKWLTENRPPRKRPPSAPSHVDWAKRDEALAGQIATIAAQIKNRPGRPRRVTVTAIGRALGKQSLFEAALAKLILTRSVIRGVLESGVDFAVRRVHMAAAKLRQTEGEFPRWKLVCAGGVYHRLERLPQVKAALDYEMRPPVQVVIIRDGDPIPQGLIRSTKRTMPRIRPLAIVRSVP